MSGERLIEAAGVAPAAAMAAALEGRADILSMTDRSRESVLRPAAPGGLSHALRAALAVRICRLSGEEALADLYAADLAAADPAPEISALAAPGAAPADPWTAALVAHADAATTAPRDATAADIDRLRAAGVSEPDIVRLSQLVAFLAYEARVVAGLRLMGGA
jgi:uncharacterized protein YciW